MSVCPGRESLRSLVHFFYIHPNPRVFFWPQGHSTVGEDDGGDGSGLGPREFKALEGLTPVEARLLVTSLVEDATASGIGDMLRKEEASKQVTQGSRLPHVVDDIG